MNVDKLGDNIVVDGAARLGDHAEHETDSKPKGGANNSARSALLVFEGPFSSHSLGKGSPRCLEG